MDGVGELRPIPNGSGIAGYEYQTSPDNSTWSSATAGNSVDISTQGTTYVQFRAIDNSGNTSAWSSSATVKLDSVAPSVPTLTGGSGSWFTTSPQSVRPSGSTDATSGGITYRYQTSPDNTTWSAATTASSVSVSTQGTTYVRFAAVDAAGNASAYSSSVTVKIDTVAPSVPTLTGGGASWFTTSPQSVTASGSTDATSGGITYRYQTSPDNTTWSAFTAGSSASMSTQGTTYVRFAAVDAAGNVSAYSASVTVKIDNVAPSVPTLTGGGASWFTTSPQSVTGSGSTDATSGGVTYRYQTSPDNTTWSAFTAGSSASVSTQGTTYVRFAAVDAAGNVSAYSAERHGQDRHRGPDRAVGQRWLRHLLDHGTDDLGQWLDGCHLRVPALRVPDLDQRRLDVGQHHDWIDQDVQHLRCHVLHPVPLGGQRRQRVGVGSGLHRRIERGLHHLGTNAGHECTIDGCGRGKPAAPVALNAARTSR